MSDSENVVPITSGQQGTAAVTGASGTTADNQGSTPQSQGSNAPITSMTPIGSMEALKKRAPAVYKAMMEGIAYNMISEMKRSNDRLITMIKEHEREAA